MRLIRDRMTMGEEEMLELRKSIAASGLRLPIEVFELEAPGGAGQRYGLLSGYRRMLATRGLLELTGADKYRKIKAIVRPRADAGSAFVSMIEENEVRENLSYFERGRIAVMAANQGAFTNTEDAVNRLFATGSKAKRSKIRSFALIFEELGDMLLFPEGLTERHGLLLASALRQGAEAQLREALSSRLAARCGGGMGHPGARDRPAGQEAARPGARGPSAAGPTGRGVDRRDDLADQQRRHDPPILRQ